MSSSLTPTSLGSSLSHWCTVILAPSPASVPLPQVGPPPPCSPIASTSSLLPLIHTNTSRLLDHLLPLPSMPALASQPSPALVCPPLPRLLSPLSAVLRGRVPCQVTATDTNDKFDVCCRDCYVWIIVVSSPGKTWLCFFSILDQNVNLKHFAKIQIMDNTKFV